MEGAVTFIPILFRNPYLNLPLPRAAPAANSCTLQSPASHFPRSLTLPSNSLYPCSEIPSLAPSLSTVMGPGLASPPHLQPFSDVPRGIPEPLPRSSSTVLCRQSAALDNTSHRSSSLLLQGCQALSDKCMHLYSLRG